MSDFQFVNNEWKILSLQLPAMTSSISKVSLKEMIHTFTSLHVLPLFLQQHGISWPLWLNTGEPYICEVHLNQRQHLAAI